MAESNPSHFDLIIAGCWDRGHAIMQTLVSRGWKIAFLDLTPSLEMNDASASRSTDAEGPFGLFQTPDLTVQDFDSFNAGGRVSVGGLSIWLKKGPMEMAGGLAEFHRRSFEIPPTIADAVKTEKTKTSDVSRRPFQDAWLFYLAQACASPQISDGLRAFGKAKASPLYSPLIVRACDRASRDQALAKFAASGVHVVRDARIESIQFGLKTDTEIRLKTETLSTRTLVWTPTSFETKQCLSNLENEFYPNGAIEPVWLWSRARIEIKTRKDQTQPVLPDVAWVIEDIELPWCERNFAVLKKSGEATVDVWLLIEKEKLGIESALRELQSSVVDLLQNRFPEATLELTESLHSVLQYGLFEKHDRNGLKTKKFKSLFFNGPEDWDSLDPLGRIRHERAIVDRLEVLKAEWIAAQKKAAARRKEVSP